ncbi:MAG: proteasome protein [Oscillatoria sp. SIO1A7]|nr:proteasome protein [Oscillatoria sp. SIO1A7]
MATERLLEFQKYGKFILDKIRLVANQPDLKKDWVPSRLRPCIDRLQEAARKTVERASSPVKIGVMGEFSSGKTLLLGSLLGYADALPVSENPTTGNVTAIHLLQQEEFQTTKIEKFEVTYLDRQGVIDCLSFMLAEAEERAKAAGLSSSTDLQGLKLQDAGADSEILRWCEEAWNQTKNPDLRYLLRELVLFVRADRAYSGALGGKTKAIDPEVARIGLDLGAPAMNIQTMGFNELPPEPEQLQNSPQSLPELLLQNSFPLIRRVDVTVKVSKEIWDLSALKTTNEFVLLDFPGLGAANSGVRDTFLSLRELDEVQTILVLLDGKSPGGGTANQIFTLMEQRRPGEDLKDRILVGVGRFDLLPLSNDGGEKILDELIGDRAPFEGMELLVAEPLDEETVLEKLTVLRTIIASGRSLTPRPERIVLLSPMLALADLAKESPREVAVGSEKFLQELEYPHFLDRSTRLQKKWEKLSELLEQYGSGGTLGRQLGYFAEDGGIGKLREAIAEHVKTHGIKQLDDDVSKAARELQKEQQVLENILEEIEKGGIPTNESPTFVNLRKNIEALASAYKEFQSKIGSQPLPDRRGVPVSSAVYDELAFRIFNWEPWNLLFQRANKGIITLSQSSDSDDDILGDIIGEQGLGEYEASENGIPTRSDDFYPAFEQTIREVEGFARDRIRQAVADLLSDLSDKLQSQRNELGEILPDDKVKERIQLLQKKYGKAAAGPLQILVGVATEPKRLQNGILKRCDLLENENAGQSTLTLQVETAFPLARGDKSHHSGQVFAWAPERTQNNPKPVDHQVIVLRLRDEIIASAGLQIVQFVSEKDRLLNQILRNQINQIIDNLKAMLNQEALLRDIAEGDETGSASTPVWLRNLSQIASTPSVK